MNAWGGRLEDQCFDLAKVQESETQATEVLVAQ